MKKIGSLYLFKPRNISYNPDLYSPPRIGIYLGMKIENMIIPRYIMVGPNGMELLWNNRWEWEEI